jgi:hypothetical protein
VPGAAAVLAEYGGQQQLASLFSLAPHLGDVGRGGQQQRQYLVQAVQVVAVAQHLVAAAHVVCVGEVVDEYLELKAGLSLVGAGLNWLGSSIRGQGARGGGGWLLLLLLLLVPVVLVLLLSFSRQLAQPA